MRGDRPFRVFAIVAVALLVAYELMRVAAQSCSGSACDAYIPLSLLLPIAILVMVAITGGLAVLDARPVGGPWLFTLSIATALSVLGPLVAVAVFSPSPDIVVPAASFLFGLTPLAALIYGVRKVSPRSR